MAVKLAVVGLGKLSKGGIDLSIGGVQQILGDDAEYPNLYAYFAELIAAGRSDVDLRPLRHVADAFLRAGRLEVEPFVEEEPLRAVMA